MAIIDIIKSLIDSIFSSFIRKEPQSAGTQAVSSSIEASKQSVDTVNKSITIDDVNRATVSPPPVAKFGFAAEPRVTSGFNWRQIPGILNGQRHFHPAIDFSAWMKFGSPVRAPESGTVILCKADPTGCTFVAIKGDISGGYHYLVHTGTKDGQPSNLVKVGDKVKTGQVVGFTNNTGAVTGSHVHHAYYTPKWIPVDVIRCFYKRFAPELYSQITYYQDAGQLAPGNNTGHCCGEWGD